LKIHER